VSGNWGRWGPDDERGALNLVDGDAVRVDAAGGELTFEKAGAAKEATTA